VTKAHLGDATIAAAWLGVAEVAAVRGQAVQDTLVAERRMHCSIMCVDSRLEQRSMPGISTIEAKALECRCQ
jgi:hypothetical protein